MELGLATDGPARVEPVVVKILRLVDDQASHCAPSASIAAANSSGSSSRKNSLGVAVPASADVDAGLVRVVRAEPVEVART